MAVNREVTIKVTVETNVSAAQNGLKGMDASAKALESTIAGLKKQLSSLNTAGSSSQPGSSQIESLIREIADSNRALSGRSVGIRGPAPVRSQSRGMPSAAEVQAEIARHRSDMKDAGYTHGIGFQKLKQDVSDNDVSNAVAATNRQKAAQGKNPAEKAIATNQQYRQSSLQAATGAAEFAKGLALVVAAQDDADKSMIRMIASAQGYFNILRGGMNAIEGLKSSKSSGTSAAPGGGIGGGGGGIGMANPYAVVAAAALATAVALRELNISARKLEETQKEYASAYAGIRADAANQSSGRYGSHIGRMANAIPNSQAMTEGVTNQFGRGVVEGNIRSAQAASTRDFAGREEIRSRMEQRNAMQEQIASAQGGFQQATRQQGVFKGAREELLARQSEAKLARDNRLASLKKQRKDLGNDGLMANGETGGLFGQGSILRHVFTGSQTTNQKRADNTKINAQIATQEGENATAEKSAKEDLNRLDKEEVDAGRKKVETAVELVQRLREQASISRQMHEQDKEANASTYRGIGSMTKGEQLRLKRIQDKVDKGQTLTKHEQQTALGAQGTEVRDQVLKQTEAEGRGVGIRANREKEEAASAVQRRQDEADLKAQGPGLNEMEKQSQKNVKDSEALIGGIKEAFDLEEVAARLTELGRTQRTFMEQAIADLKAWFQ